MEQLVTYLFGRLNMIAHYEDKQAFLLDLMTRGVSKLVRNYNWAFVDVDILDTDHGSFIFGCVAKYLPSDGADVVDRETKRSTKVTLRDHIIAKSPFLLHVKSGVIAYHPIGTDIRDGQFRDMFGELLELAQDNIMINAEIQIIDQENRILEVIRQFTSIKSLSIDLHPSNPSNRARWKRTDDRLHQMGVLAYRQKYTSLVGLRIDEDGDAYGDILMASDGYGRAVIEGKIGDKRAVASTDRMPVTGESSSEGEPKGILGNLMDKFIGIWERMRKP